MSLRVIEYHNSKEKKQWRNSCFDGAGLEFDGGKMMNLERIQI